MKSNHDTIRQLLVFVLVMATITVNGLANALPINGQTTAEISDSFDVLFVPAGYVFSIWGLIYLGLVAYAVYQVLPSQARNRDLRRIGPPFIVASLANIGWILLWHYEQFPATVAVMLLLLVCLIAIYRRLDIGRQQPSAAMRWLVRLPFSIYLGWISVATIANIADLLTYWGWGGWGISPVTWTVIMLAVATALGALASFTRGDTAFAAVLIWAFSGIALKHGDTPAVATAAWVATVATAVMMIAGAAIRRRQPRRPLALA